MLGLIKPASPLAPEEDFLVFSPSGREIFETYPKALEYARNTGKDIVLEHMMECGLNPNQVEISVKEKTLIPEGWTHPPLETKLVVTGVGSSRLDS
jgi:hypothetical protein